MTKTIKRLAKIKRLAQKLRKSRIDNLLSDDVKTILKISSEAINRIMGQEYGGAVEIIPQKTSAFKIGVYRNNDNALVGSYNIIGESGPKCIDRIISTYYPTSYNLYDFQLRSDKPTEGEESICH